MNTESPRLRALLAAGATVLVFGITIPAMAAPEHAPGRPADGTAGVANEKARPKGQSIDKPGSDSNNGFRCDSNGGAGAGNPALGSCPDGGGDGGGGGGYDGNTETEGPGDGSGDGSGGTGYVPPSS